jgi:two-component system, OmpR family, alkaline phosphatase synthesis response regulator PhoP
MDSADHKNPAAADSPTILVVEDEEGLLEIIALNLEASGYRVLTAADGMTALRLFESDPPDLVVLDINLPDVSGFRLLELFRGSGRGAVPVLALTALDFAEAEDLVRHGLDGFMTKPFHPTRLVQSVRHLLGQPDEPEERPTA